MENDHFLTFVFKLVFAPKQYLIFSQKSRSYYTYKQNKIRSYFFLSKIIFQIQNKIEPRGCGIFHESSVQYYFDVVYAFKRQRWLNQHIHSIKVNFFQGQNINLYKESYRSTFECYH